MSLTTAIILGVCVLLAIYLAFALLKPERF
jgi:K+-transporting ATPase KdpF subunit